MKKNLLKLFLNFLNKKNIETRSIISGNFANQPAIKLYNIKFNKQKLNNSNEIDQRGFFIGLPTIKFTPKKLTKISNLLLHISKI